MATGIRISQLPSIDVLTNDDVLIVNDGDANTRKITYGNLSSSIGSRTQISTEAPLVRANGGALQDGDKWWNPTTAVESTYYNGEWVVSAGVVENLPTTNVSLTQVIGSDPNMTTQEDANAYFSSSINIIAGSINDSTITINDSEGNLVGSFTTNSDDAVTIGLPPTSGFSGSYDDLTNKPTIGEAVITINDNGGNEVGNFNVNATADSSITLPLGFSGEYDDLLNTPTIPDAANNATLTIADSDGNSVGTFTADASADVTITLPAVSGFSGSYDDLTNTPDLSAKADLVGGVVPTSQIPAVALSNYRGSPADEAGMIALSDASVGDWCYRSDEDAVYILLTAPYSDASNWQVVGNTAGVVTVNGQSGPTVVLAPSDIGAATAEQGGKADTAVQPAAIGTAAAEDVGYFATAAQGTKADSALQDASAFATAEQGAKADSALQDGSLYATAEQGAKADTALQDGTLYATAEQGGKADSALQSDAIGVSIQGYDANTVVDADYATVKSNANGALQDASAFATAEQGTKADSALQSAAIGVSIQGYDANTVADADYSTVKTNANSALQSAAIGVSIQGYNVNTVVDADYATVKSNANSAIQRSADAITETTLATDGSESVDSLATAINTLTADLAAILNTIAAASTSSGSGSGGGY